MVLLIVLIRLKTKKTFLIFGVRNLHFSVASLAKQVGVKPGNAQRWMKEFKVAGEEELSLVKSRGKVSKPKLNDNHKDFLKDYVDENSSSN